MAAPRCAQTASCWTIELVHNAGATIPNVPFDRAVIVIHGSERNAQAVFDNMVIAAEQEGVAERTFIVAPAFKTAADQPEDEEYVWIESGWMKGFRAVNGERLSSFAVIDDLVQAIVASYPEVDLITVVGHSAGGQFTQRYAALNRVQATLGSAIEMRYVVANPSSYMWPTANRPQPTAGCPDYDDYKYGLADLPGSLAYTARPQAQILAQLLTNDLHLLLGTEDNNPNASDLDTSCPAAVQGDHRLARGTAYYAEIMALDNAANHCLAEVTGVGHSSLGIFSSEEGRKAILRKNITCN